MFWMPWRSPIINKSDAPDHLVKTQGKGETFFYGTKRVSKDIFSLCAMREDACVFIGFSRTEEGLAEVLEDGKSRAVWRKASWIPLNKEIPTIRKIEFWGTPFQRSIWHELLNIAEGKIVTYQSVAEKIGHPTSCRAVGAAIGANPISGIVPCHRVVSKQMDMTAYHWGFEIKETFLRQEQEDSWRKTSYIVSPEALSQEMQSRMEKRSTIQSFFL